MKGNGRGAVAVTMSVGVLVSFNALPYHSLNVNPFGLAGPLPPEWGNLDRISELHLYWNYVTGA
jgi:hypothetical protein